MGAVAEDTRLEQLRADVEACGPAAVELFEQIMANGETAEWAAMCACRKAPGSRNTDRAFCEGARRRMETMVPEHRTKILEMARKAGINTQGKFYKSGLGRYDDPAAWVSSADDLLTTCKKKNLNCEGVINHKAVEREIEVKPVPLAEDIIKRRALEIMKKEPKTAAKVKRGGEKAKRELRERIIATHGAPAKS